MSDETDEQRSGLSRRDALKRGAAVGGALWVAPLVTAAPAFGAEGSFGDLPDCVPLWVKYGDPDPIGPDTDLVFPLTALPGNPGEWDDNINSNYDTPCVGEYPVSTDNTEWVKAPQQPGMVVSPTTAGDLPADEYVETWTAGYGTRTFTFTAIITATRVTISVVDDKNAAVPVLYALWKQAESCYPPGDSQVFKDKQGEPEYFFTGRLVVSGNTVSWSVVDDGVTDGPAKVSHISFVICG